MTPRFIKSSITMGVVCAVAGAASGIASSSATSSSKAGSPKPPMLAGKPGAPGFQGPTGPPRAGGPGIHSEVVLPDEDGSGFVTRISDSGTLTAISGNDLTIKQGTAKETYDTVTVTAQGEVTVFRNGKTSTLDKVAVGDHVHVSMDGTDTFVMASTAAWEKKRRGQLAPSWPTV